MSNVAPNPRMTNPGTAASLVRSGASTAPEGLLSRVLRWYLYFAWMQILFDFHRLAGLGRLDTVITMGVLVVAVLNGMHYLNRLWRLFPLVLLFTLLPLLAAPYALNTGFIQFYMKVFFQFWVFGVATFVTLREPRQILPILFLFSVQYVWWFVNGMPSGLVWWHPSLGDENTFASIMVIGAAWCYYFGRGASRRWMRVVGMIGAALCLVGMVPSMARGATLALALLIPLVVWRSPRKGRTLAGVAAGGVVFAIAVNAFLPEGQFIDEFTSIFEQGTTEGTGEDRWIVWTASLKTWALTHPITGLGMGNAGLAASQQFGLGELGGLYAANPARLSMMSMHNDWVQILSEMGLLGFGTYLFMIYTFFRNGRRMRGAEYRDMWSRHTDGILDLKLLSFAFETGMIALLINGLFYPQLDRVWFWALVIVQFWIYHNVRERVQTERAMMRHRTELEGAMAPRWDVEDRPRPGHAGVLAPAQK